MEMTVIAQRSELIAWYQRRGYELTGETRPFPYDNARAGLPRRDDLQFVVLEDARPALARSRLGDVIFSGGFRRNGHNLPGPRRGIRDTPVLWIDGPDPVVVSTNQCRHRSRSAVVDRLLEVAPDQPDFGRPGAKV